MPSKVVKIKIFSFIFIYLHLFNQSEYLDVFLCFSEDEAIMKITKTDNDSFIFCENSQQLKGNYTF